MRQGKIRKIGRYSFEKVKDLDETDIHEFDEAAIGVEEIKQEALDDTHKDDAAWIDETDVAVLFVNNDDLPIRRCLNCHHDPFAAATSFATPPGSHTGACDCRCHPNCAGDAKPVEYIDSEEPPPFREDPEDDDES